MDPKLWNKMRAKANRLCSYTKNGKLHVSEDIHKMWLQTGAVQKHMIQLMVSADGNRAPCLNSISPAFPLKYI